MALALTSHYHAKCDSGFNSGSIEFRHSCQHIRAACPLGAPLGPSTRPLARGRTDAFGVLVHDKASGTLGRRVVETDAPH